MILCLQHCDSNVTRFVNIFLNNEHVQIIPELWIISNEIEILDNVHLYIDAS